MRRFVGTWIVEMLSHGAAVIAIMGVVASSAYLLTFLKANLPPLELVISAISVCLAILSGAFSIYIARGAKLLRISPRVFLSYSHDNKDMARDVANALRSAGACVWFDEEKLSRGDEIFPTITKAIEEANSFVMLLSREPGPNLRFELGVARANNVPVITAASEDGKIPSELQSVYRIRLRADEPERLVELVQAAVNPVPRTVNTTVTPSS